MPTSSADRFGALRWSNDRFELDEWTFLLQPADAARRGSDEHLMFYKTRAMVRDYETVFCRRPDFRVETMLELGLWDGGSLAFWLHVLDPNYAIGVDLSTDGDSAYFTNFVRQKSLASHVETHWGVDQSDGERLKAILGTRLGSLNLVIDDASHLYGPTLASFEALFPHLRPGGLYIIEDWAWEHWPQYSGRDAVWRFERPMGDLIHDLVRLTATGPIASVEVFRKFVVVEKSQTEEVPDPYCLEDHIVRRNVPRRSLAEQAERVANRLRRKLARRRRR